MVDPTTTPVVDGTPVTRKGKEVVAHEAMISDSLQAKPKRARKKKESSTPKEEGKPSTTKKPATRRRSSAKKTAQEDKLTSIVMGIAIPLMVLSCSHSVSTFWSPAPLVATAFAVVGLSIMAVSISHLTDSLMVATKSPRRAAFLMALTVDALVALPEITAVMGMAEWVQYTTMISMTLISMRLNVTAFLRH